MTDNAMLRMDGDYRAAEIVPEGTDLRVRVADGEMEIIMSADESMDLVREMRRATARDVIEMMAMLSLTIDACTGASFDAAPRIGEDGSVTLMGRTLDHADARRLAVVLRRKLDMWEGGE